LYFFFSFSQRSFTTPNSSIVSRYYSTFWVDAAAAAHVAIRGNQTITPKPYTCEKSEIRKIRKIKRILQTRASRFFIFLFSWFNPGAAPVEMAALIKLPPRL
jgi:hypothetical protein